MATRTGVSDAQPGSILLVIHDFVARSGDELSLAKGDRIELSEKDDEFCDGWFLGKHLTNGKSGLFPAVYTAPAPKGTLTSANRIARPGEPVTTPPQDTASTPTAPPSQQNPPATPASTHSSASSQSPLAQRTSLSAVASQARTFAVNNDSPVMNETLSVIDEHITDMRAPRSSSYANGNKRDTITSVYSTQPLGHHSYIAGAETDEEEQQAYTQEEVMAWGPDRMAEYLEDGGVEPAHCRVFREQDISGEVFLAMDQNSLFIKEFDLGSVGRRLKTWHKIKALQDEIRSPPPLDPGRNVSSYSVPEDGDLTADANRHRASTLPRALSTANKASTKVDVLQGARPPSLGAARSSGLAVSPLQNMTSMTRDDAVGRPSAQGIRDMNHSRRHSSIASIESLSTDAAARAAAKKHSGTESRWQPSQTILNGKGTHGYTTSVDAPWRNSVAPSSPGEVERGYFSSTEVDDRHRRRNLLSKRNSNAVSPSHSRNTSTVTTNRASIISGSTVSTRDPLSPTAAPGSQSTTQSSRFSAFRSATSMSYNKNSASSRSNVHPVVTKLDPEKPVALDAITASPVQEGETPPANPTSSPSSFGMSLFASAKAKVSGFRSTSEAVTKDEKSPTERTPMLMRHRTVGSPTGASTPSTETKSLELTKSDMNSRASTGSAGVVDPPPAKRRPRAKSKKFTSAYTKGLEKKTPAEQMLTCDYSGWMKKKSGSLMTTWKPRLFVLRGRRLSYYYSDQDTEEKGLIDISFHRVLPATTEMLPALHATVTGAAASPTTPENQHLSKTATPTISEQDLRNHPPNPTEAADDSGLFIFKLVPPKSGLAKGVNFTKPTVHYFAVNSRQEGRLWMAALMKATIERNGDSMVTTTYNQKTISLAKARARKERPPALREEGNDDDENDDDDDNENDAGDITLVGMEDMGIEESIVDLRDLKEKGLGIGGFGHGEEENDVDDDEVAVEEEEDDVTPGAERGGKNFADSSLLEKKEEKVSTSSSTPTPIRTVTAVSAGAES